MFGFRIHIKLSKYRYINIAEEVISFEYRKHIIEMEGHGAIKDSYSLLFTSTGFESEQEAIDFAEDFRHSVQIASCIEKIGLDFGFNTKRSVLGKPIKDLAKARGLKILDDIHGMVIFKDDGTEVVSISSNSVLRVGTNFFLQRISENENFSIDSRITSVISRDLYLNMLAQYSKSFVRESQIDKFIAQVGCLEMLIEKNRKKREADCIDLIEQIKKEVESSSIDIVDREELVQIVSGMKRDGIKKTGKRLIHQIMTEKFMEQEPSAFFSKAYDLRSNLAHAGYERLLNKKEKDIVNNFESFVRLILIRIIGKQEQYA